jgi:choline dehydrogenase-like flavoprotein
MVDSHANVYGVQGLRVVDASSFPFLPPGHPQYIASLQQATRLRILVMKEKGSMLCTP